MTEPVEGEPFIQTSRDEVTDPHRSPLKRRTVQLVRSDDGEHRTTKPTRFASLWKIWRTEALSVLLGFTAFVAIVVVLDKFDQQSLPEWPSNITLNTFLAVVSTLARAAFMFPVSVAISQTQWTWFRKARPLHDFHLLDQASRSPWGSLVLLWRVRVLGHPVALGALLTVLGGLTSPISQLAITYPVHDVLDPGGATAPAVRSVNFPRDSLDDGTRKALILGPVSDATNFTRPLDPLSGASCSTGNCTFPDYHSLGVCVRTANITSHLTVDRIDGNVVQPSDMPLAGPSASTIVIPGATVYRASLPGGFDLAHQGPMAALVDILNGSESFGFSARNEEHIGPLSTRIASFVNVFTVPTVVGSEWSDERGSEQGVDIIMDISSWRYEAVEVLFYLCVQTYETSVAKGEEKIQLVGQLAKRAEDSPAETPFLDINCTSFVYSPFIDCTPNPSRYNDIIHLAAPESKSPASPDAFSANYHALERMARIMQTSLAGYSMTQYHPDLFPSPANFYNGVAFILTLFEDVLFRLDSLTDNAARWTRLDNLYLNIATSLSSMMRVGPPRRYANDAFNVTGHARRESPYVRVRWGWLAFLAAELVLAAAFIGITAVRQPGSNTGASKAGSDADSDSAVESGSDSPDGVPPDLKDSSLAALVVLGNEGREMMLSGGGMKSAGELEARSKGLRVRLERGEIVPVESESGEDHLA